MSSTTLELDMGNSQSYILNKDMTYDSSSVSQNKKWVDTDYIISTRKNKTIYVVKAKNDWSGNLNNSVFFGSSGLSQWAGFATDDNRPDPLNGSVDEPAPIYGNINANLLGISGSLNDGMYYNTNPNTALSGSINVSPNLTYFTGNVTTAIAPGLPSVLYGANVDARTGSTLFNFATSSNYNWNRLVNANINGTVVVNASTDPCDTTGAPISLPNTFLSGNAYTNELYRHQFSVKRAVNNNEVKSRNPIYVVRVERFGRNTTVSNSLNESLFATQFTEAFYSNVANIAADNIIYSNSITNCSKIEISGNIIGSGINIINGNYFANLSSNTDLVVSGFTTDYTVSVNQLKAEDMIVGNLRTSLSLFRNEKVFFVQANLNANSGVFLQGNVSLDTTSYSILGKNYTVINPNTVFIANTADSTQTEKNPKVISIFGSTLNGNSEWVYSNVYTGLSNIPQASGVVTSAENSRTNLDVFTVKGDVELTNYRTLFTTTRDISGNPFISSVPSYIENVTFDAAGLSINDNINGNGLVWGNGNVGGILKDVSAINRNFVFNGNVVSRSCNIAPEYHLFVFGNTKENERANVSLSSVVVNANSFVANAWNSSVNPTVRINYDESLPNSLFLDDALSKSTPTYKLVFNDWVGKSVINNAQVTFSPNISILGNANDVSANVQQMNSLLPVLNNNSHLKQLCLDEVLYTEFSVSENTGKTWTDQGFVCGLDTSNYKYNAILPQYGNLVGNLSANQSMGVNINDTFINSIATFSKNDTINPNDVHKLSFYDLQYKSYVSAVKRPGTTDLNNDAMHYSNNSSPDEINANVYMNDAYNSNLISNISAQSFLTFTYTDMSEISPPELMYPFFRHDDTTNLTNYNINSDADKKKYLFPGFKYNASNEFFSYKTANECDFQIDTSVNVNALKNFRFFAVDETNKTVKVSLDNGAAKTLPLRAIKLGNRNINSSSYTSVMNWYSYLTVFLINSTGRKDFMVLLFKLKDDNTVPNDVPTSLPDDVKNFLPVAVHVKPVGSWNEDKVKFTVAHRAFDSSGVSLSQYTSDSDYTTEVDLNTFYAPSVTDATNASISVNVFSQPINNLLVTMQFKGSTIKDLATYSRTDFNLGDIAIEGSTLSGLMGTSLNNKTSANMVDTNNNKLLNLKANSTRFYLDGTDSGIYFDKDNLVNITNNFVLRVYRSVSYSLYRDEEFVGSGLLTRTSDADVFMDIIEENLSATKGGFKLQLTHNLVDLCARLHMQSINTLANQNNNLEFIIKTNPDNLNINVASYNPVNKTYIRIERNIRNHRANQDINLSTYFNGKLPTIKLSSVRGYPYSLDVATNGTNASVNTNNISSCIFSLKFVLDNYTIYKPSTGAVLNGDNRCVFTSETSPSTNFTNDFKLDFNNYSVSSYLQVLPSTHTRLLTLFNTGYGEVTYIVEDFVGHYNTALPLSSYSVPGSSTNTNNLSKNFNHTIGSTYSLKQASITMDSSGNYSFSIDLGVSTRKQVFVFSGSAYSYPTAFSGKCASVLYTGTRAIVFYSAKIGSDSRTYTDAANNLWSFNSAREAFVGQSASLVNAGIVSEQLYAVVLPNSTRDRATDFVTFASLKLNTKTSAFDTTPNLGWAGVFINSASFNNKLTLKVTKGDNTSRSLILAPSPLLKVVRNNEESDDEICDNSSNPVRGFNSYSIRLNNVPLFTLGLKEDSDFINNFNYEIKPSKVHFYEAYDQNADNIVNNVTVNSSALTANFLSDIVYNISNSAAMTNTIKPSFSYDLDNSATFNNGWLSVIGSALEMKFNNKFSLGYSLDCYFVVKSNTLAEFDVYEISSDSGRANNNINASIAPYSLTAIKRRVQTISDINNWAVSNNTDTGARSGMSFKLSSSAVVKQGDVVNIFCDNLYQQDNKLSWQILNMENNVSRTFSLDYHDDERYAELLNNQLSNL